MAEGVEGESGPKPRRPQVTAAHRVATPQFI